MIHVQYRYLFGIWNSFAVNAADIVPFKTDAVRACCH